LAFTLVELLVVIGIIGILMTLLMPAVLSVRESGRRVTCKSNLRQIGLAIRSYTTIHGMLPPSGIVGDSPVDHPRGFFQSRSGNMFSWVVLILPQIDGESLFERFDFTKTVLEQPSDPQAVPLSILRCPSDSADGRFFVDSELTRGKRFAKGNYAAFVSPFHIDLQPYFPGALIGKGQTLARIRDGESNTLMLSEVRTRAHEQDQRGAWALPWNGATLLAFDMHHSEYGLSGRYEASPGSLGLTQVPNCQGPNIDILYKCPDAAGAQMENMPCGTWAEGWNYYLSSAPRSQHTGGVNVVFVDGHIGFLADTVDEFAMAYMVSIDDGQAVDTKTHVR